MASREEKYLLGYNDALEDIQKVAGEEGLDIEGLGGEGTEGDVETIIDAYNQGVAAALEEAGIEKEADDVLGTKDGDLSDEEEAFARGYTEALEELGIEIEDEEEGVEKDAAAVTLLKNRLLSDAFGKEAAAKPHAGRVATGRIQAAAKREKLLRSLGGKTKSLGKALAGTQIGKSYMRRGKFGRIAIPATMAAGAAAYPTLRAIRARRGR